MLLAKLFPQADVAGFASQRVELRRDYLSIVLGGGWAALVLALLRAAAWRDAPGLFHTWQVVAVLGVSLSIAQTLKAHRPRVASWAFVFGLMGANMAEAVLFPHGPALYFFAIIGVVSSLLHSQRGAGISVLLILACMAFTGFILLPELVFHEVVWPIIVSGLVSVVAWMGTRQLYTVLQWEWYSTQQAMAVAREAQNHRAELMRLNKELDGAYIRLERMNRMLILARRQAEDATALKMQFANAVSHELRSPINMILGFSDMMVSSPEVYGSQPWPPRLKQHIQQIYQSSTHLSQLIDDVLDMARIDAYRLALVKTSTSIESVVAEAYEMVQSLFEARHLYLRAEVEPNLPPFMLDGTRIRQVLLNLLTNAVRFTSRGGVTIRAYRDHGKHEKLETDSDAVYQSLPSVVISITDTGIGINQDDLPKLFQEFGQLDNAFRWSRGAGLGLFISKQLVALHGGRIWAESEPEHGTTFLFALPIESEGLDMGLELADRAAVQTATATSSAGSGSTMNPLGSPDAFWSNLERKARERKTVLFVGNEPRVQRLLSAEFRGYDMTWLPNDSSMNLMTETTANIHPSAIVQVGSDAAPVGSPIAFALPLENLMHQLAGVPIIRCNLPGLIRSGVPRSLSNYLIKPVSRRKLAEALSKLEAEHDPQKGDPQKGDPQQGRIRHVLVVDDDAAMREFLTLTLAHLLGDQVVIDTAADAATALQCIEDHRPDTVLLDLNLPDMDGFDLADKIFEMHRGTIRTIAVTARDPEEDQYVTVPDTLTCLRLKRFSQREIASVLATLVDGFSGGGAVR